MVEQSWLDEHVELYAVGALDADEIVRFEQEITRVPAGEQQRYRREVAQTRDALASLSAEYATPPPPKVRELVMADLTSPDQNPVSDRSEGTPPSNVVDLAARRRRINLAVGAVAAALMLIIGGVLVGRVTAPEAGGPVAQGDMDKQMSQVLQAPDMQLQQVDIGGGASVTVVASREENLAVVMADKLPDVPAGQTYQMWLMGEDHDPLSVGLMQGSPGRQAIAVDDVAGSDTFGVTLEPAGGSPGPTSDPVVSVAF